mgnify:CR=1 FL=1|tara:strand:+ start:108 stop:914 length:807 start_codon:yes stop_codon:yes gene_type:complete
MIILTGYNGFIGQAFIKELDPENLYRVEQDGAFKFLEEYEDWEKVELILHQGAISSTTETDIEKIYQYNIKFSIELFKKAIEYKIPVKYASSASLYGKIHATYGYMKGAINPLNYYALSKATVDYWVLDHINEFESVQGFRYFNVYGEGEDSKGDQASPVSKFTKQAREDRVIKIFEDSEYAIRDFVYVGDVVNVVLNNTAGSGIYDVGTGEPISFEDVAELIAEKEGAEIKQIPFPEHLKEKYQEYTCADNSWYDYEYKSVKSYLQA